MAGLLLQPALLAAGFGASSPVPTGHDVLQQGLFAFDSGDNARAEAVLNGFLADYGKSVEAAQVLEQVIQLLAYSQIRQGKFEAAQGNIEKYLNDYPSGSETESFVFWRGVALLKTGKPKEAEAALRAYLQKYPASKRSDPARFSLGQALLAQNKYKETADYFTELEKRAKPDMASQARLLVVHARIKSGQYDAALDSLQTLFSDNDNTPKISARHLLALDLGSRLLNDGQYRKALLALQKVWPKDRLVTRQTSRLAALESTQKKLSSSPVSDPTEQIQIQDSILQIRAELDQLKNMPDYDAALQFRIAQAFLHLNRYREANLVLRQMVGKLSENEGKGEWLMQADYTRVVALAHMQRWREAIQVADEFAGRFSKSPLLPEVLYLKAESCRQSKDYNQSVEIFQKVAAQYPGFAQADRCLFMAAYGLLLQERNTEAAALFQEFREKFPKSGWIERSWYWEAMAWHFNKDYAKSREAHRVYLEKYFHGIYAADSSFRRAQALFYQKDFNGACKELEAFLKRYPGSEPADEAVNLLGDCWLALGETERGLEAYSKNSGRDRKLADYAVFRVGQVYKATEQYDRMRAHFETFVREHPESPRIAEALGKIAWVYRRQEQPEKALELYWDAVSRYGNDPEASAVEDMLRALAKYYHSPEEKERLMGKLSTLGAESAAKNQRALAARMLWMQAQLEQGTAPEAAAEHLLRIPGLAEPRELSSILLADVGDVLLKAGKSSEAAGFYMTILSWYPNSALRDRSYAGLGLVAKSQGKTKQALEYFERFDRENAQPASRLRVLQARAEIFLERGDTERALGQLEQVLKIPSARGLPAVEALYKIGEIYLGRGDAKRAIPYFQRIYVMYGRWGDYVARAYWQSGQAFERLEMRQEAANTYRELIGNEQLKGTAEYAQARERLNAL
ncbi:MAG: tetratricopeptide repeat protein [Methylacidiphilales bacterium]|nr:tetratricopeptide repeat protein [Candidatus Methylacidiphilales bacterium]